MTLIGSPSGVNPCIGFPQIHTPYLKYHYKYVNMEVNRYNTLVQGLIVGPTPNPPDLLSSILFSKYDLPVLYIPATAMIPIGP
jgi:hypothetical protein